MNIEIERKQTDPILNKDDRLSQASRRWNIGEIKRSVNGEIVSLSLNTPEKNLTILEKLQIRAIKSRSGMYLHRDNIAAEILDGLPDLLRIVIKSGDYTMVVCCQGNVGLYPRYPKRLLSNNGVVVKVDK
ncbi:MAG: hypothetical protein M1142_03490 [Patescibacteria group bacterium]|nr:hypothetical protein [Patescibacteria group bacterium]